MKSHLIFQPLAEIKLVSSIFGSGTSFFGPFFCHTRIVGEGSVPKISPLQRSNAACIRILYGVYQSARHNGRFMQIWDSEVEGETFLLLMISQGIDDFAIKIALSHLVNPDATGGIAVEASN